MISRPPCFFACAPHFYWGDGYKGRYAVLKCTIANYVHTRPRKAIKVGGKEFREKLVFLLFFDKFDINGG